MSNLCYFLIKALIRYGWDRVAGSNKSRRRNRKSQQRVSRLSEHVINKILMNDVFAGGEFFYYKN